MPRCHRRMVMSAPAVARCAPSGLKSTRQTAPSWPTRVRKESPAGAGAAGRGDGSGLRRCQRRLGCLGYGLARGDREQAVLVAAEVQDRGEPFEALAAGAGWATRPDETASSMPRACARAELEAAREGDRRVVTDRVLHGGDGGHAAAREGCGGAGERVAGACRAALAGVQTTSRGMGLAWRSGQAKRLDSTRSAVPSSAVSAAVLIAIRVEVAVADEVDHVHGGPISGSGCPPRLPTVPRQPQPGRS